MIFGDGRTRLYWDIRGRGHYAQAAILARRMGWDELADSAEHWLLREAAGGFYMYAPKLKGYLRLHRYYR